MSHSDLSPPVSGSFNFQLFFLPLLRFLLLSSAFFCFLDICFTLVSLAFLPFYCFKVYLYRFSVEHYSLLPFLSNHSFLLIFFVFLPFFTVFYCLLPSSLHFFFFLSSFIRVFYLHFFRSIKVVLSLVLI